MSLTLIRMVWKKTLPCGWEPYMTPQATNSREGGLVRRLLAGGVPGQGVVVEEANKPPAGRNTQKRRRNRAVSRTFWPKYRRKRRFSFKTYTSEMFFKEYMNFNNFCYLRRYGVIPVPSFGNQIRPSHSY